MTATRDQMLRHACIAICKFANGRCDCKDSRRSEMCASVRDVAATVMELGVRAARGDARP
jgi:hypothetical protein